MVLNETTRSAIVQIQNSPIFGWIQLAGILVAFILGIMKVIDLSNNRLKLAMKVLSKKFNNRQGNGYETPSLDLEILIDINNKGKQKTSISKIIFESDNPKFNNIELNSFEMGGVPRLFPIKIDGHDRREIKFYGHKKDYIDNFDGMNGKLIFKTSHKDFIVNIKIPKNNE